MVEVTPATTSLQEAEKNLTVVPTVLPKFLQPTTQSSTSKAINIAEDEDIEAPVQTSNVSWIHSNHPTVESLWQQYVTKFNEEKMREMKELNERQYEQLWKRRIEKKVGHMTLQELQHQLSKHGLNTAGPKLELKDKLIQFLVDRKMKEKSKKVSSSSDTATKRALSPSDDLSKESMTKKQKMTAPEESVGEATTRTILDDDSTAYEQHRAQLVRQFIDSLGSFMKPSDRFLERNLSKLTIHIPLLTANPNTHQADPFFVELMSEEAKERYPFVRVYKLGSLDSVLEAGQLKSGDIVLLPPGDHFVLHNRIIDHCKHVEFIGMMNREANELEEESSASDNKQQEVVIQIQPRGPSKTSTLKFENCFVRFHQIKFCSLPNERFEVADLVRLDDFSIGLFSHCKFENEDAALLVHDSSAILNHCRFDRLGKYAIRVVNQHLSDEGLDSFIDLNHCHFTRCCIGTGEIHPKVANPTEKGNYGVIYLDDPNLKNFKFRMHNCSFKKNEADCVVFETKKLPASVVKKITESATSAMSEGNVPIEIEKTVPKGIGDETESTKLETVMGTSIGGKSMIHPVLSDDDTVSVQHPLTSNFSFTRCWRTQEEMKRYEWVDNKPSTTAIRRTKIHMDDLSSNESNQLVSSIDQLHEIVEIDNQ